MWSECRGAPLRMKSNALAWRISSFWHWPLLSSPVYLSPPSSSITRGGLAMDAEPLAVKAVFSHTLHMLIPLFSIPIHMNPWGSAKMWLLPGSLFWRAGGRVIAPHPGSHGTLRVLQIRTDSAVLSLPIISSVIKPTRLWFFFFWEKVCVLCALPLIQCLVHSKCSTK